MKIVRDEISIQVFWYFCFIFHDETRFLATDKIREKRSEATQEATETGHRDILVVDCARRRWAIEPPRTPNHNIRERNVPRVQQRMQPAESPKLIDRRTFPRRVPPIIFNRPYTCTSPRIELSHRGGSLKRALTPTTLPSFQRPSVFPHWPPLPAAPATINRV